MCVLVSMPFVEWYPSLYNPYWDLGLQNLVVCVPTNSFWILHCFLLQVIPITALALTGANVVGYVKCRKDAGAKLSAMAGQFIGHQLLKQVKDICCVCSRLL